jgi:hypothetical protein
LRERLAACWGFALNCFFETPNKKKTVRKKERKKEGEV